jgi:hypothetical protein
VKSQCSSRPRSAAADPRPGGAAQAIKPQTRRDAPARSPASAGAA